MKTKIKQLKIDRVDIVFENCESYTLQPQDITLCYTTNIMQDIGVNNFQYTNGEVHCINRCEKISLGINQKGLSRKNNWDWDDNLPLKQRVNMYDITHIHFFFNDGTDKYISVPWEDKNGDEYTNKLQNNLYFEGLNGEECMAIIIHQTPLTFKELEEEYGL